jgi:hypothetical protein
MPDAELATASCAPPFAALTHNHFSKEKLCFVPSFKAAGSKITKLKQQQMDEHGMTWVLQLAPEARERV